MFIKYDSSKQSLFIVPILILLAIPVSVSAQNIGVAFSQTLGAMTVFDDTGMKWTPSLTQ